VSGAADNGGADVGGTDSAGPVLGLIGTLSKTSRVDPIL